MKNTKDMEIIYIDVKDLKPYEKNAKQHPKEQIEQIKTSIKEFGFCDPIGVYGKDNIIVEGHGRFLACKELEIEKVPCIKLDHLTDEERKAYTLAHNKLTMNSDFDYSLLDEELKDIVNIDMSELGFDIPIYEDIEDENNADIKQNERVRTNTAYNMDIIDYENVDGWYQMPVIECDNHIPESLISFNYALSSNEYNKGVHFYIDDYQFERVWNNPDAYIDVLSKYDCIFSPDFSLYTDMPMAMKIWNIYRSRLIGQYYQQCGIKVIPTMSWCEKETFEFCFDGIPEKSIVSVSTIGVKQSKEAFQIWKDGMDEMIKRIKPRAILVYGGKVDYDYKNIKVIYYGNTNTERMKNIGEENED